ncbi:uncharacterized protein [Salminus brasiliensis]|uniref:uncharacterized protein isoform X6 n=1 Tax=Salminus brasiliensis TaxID=930266 RepID=UPI003B82F722
MACAQQSAAEYLRNARADLVTRLRNFPLITENLYQRKVLNGSEVDALKAERRNFDKARFILDCVSKKGEGASYELLRILDITRKRTLHQDSHHWICCFPFREDTEADYSVGTKPCHDYQKRLKTKAQNILRRQREQCRDRRKHKTEGKFTFVPVVLDTDTDGNSAQSKIKKKNNKCKKLRHKKLRSYLPVQKQKLSPDDLLHSREKAILLIGKPGIGKTSVVQEMLSIWSQKDSRALDYMFYFDEATLTQISSFTSLESLLFDLYCNPLEKDRKEVWQDIEEHSENVIIVFDGINTTQKNPLLQKILDGDLLPEAKIVITCRSELEDDSFLSDWPACEIYVQGFSEESVRIYLAYMLSSEAEIFLNNQELISLCHVPMYAFMVATCSSFSNLTAARHPLTITEMYVHILRQDLKKAGNKTFRQIDQYMKDIRDQLFSLMESAFSATLQKTVNLPNIDSDEIEISKVFLKKITVKATPTSVKEFHAFLHSTVQEFFSALWLLGNPDEIDKIFQLSLEKEKKHLKHLIPFLCGLLSQQNLDLLKNLFSEDKIRRASDGFFLKVMNTFVQHDEDNDEEDNSDAVFVCQCLYESQSPEACLLFLEKIHFHLDLSGQYLDPHQCCAVSYVISQSNSKQVILTLKDCDISDSGIQMILRITSHLTHLRATPSILCQIWISALGCEFFQNVTTLLDVCGKQMHLPVFGEASVFGNAGRAIGESSEKINLHLHCRENAHQLSDACPKMIFQALSQKHSLRFELPDDSLIPAKIFESIQRDLVLRAAVFESNGQQSAIVSSLLSSFYEDPFHVCNFLIKLQSLVKTDAEFHCLKIIYGLIPAVWIVDLSERKSSLFLEVLKLQTVQKPVELRGWSDEESEMKSFLQCLPYISQLSFRSQQSESNEWRKRINSFLLDLCLQAAFHQEEPVETVWKLMSNAHAEVDDFRLDLYSHVKNFESQTGRSVLPAIQQVFQSVFTLWMIDLSERKSSLFLEVLKLQTEKKPVVLRGWSDEESELRSFLQCLPFISQLSFFYFGHHALIQFLVKLTLAAAEFDVPTGQRFTRLLTSVCTYTTFPFNEYDYVNNASAQCEFLLDLFSHVKEYETETGRSVLPALQPIYQSAPVVWIIDFSERKSSHFLEVLKLQTVHKPVELWGWSDKESEVLSFLQCLPFISRLSFISPQNENEEWRKRVNSFLLDLCLKAALHQKEPAETVKKLMSCAHGGVEDFLLDLFSHVKEYETETGRSVLPALQPVYQSVPEVWIIDLSERKSSAFLEVLKLQTVKKPVVLRGWSDEESEVRSFLQCLPYISQLSGAEECFLTLCKLSWRTPKAEQVAPFLQALGFTLSLEGNLPTSNCRAVGRVLGLSASRLNLTLNPQAISLRGTRVLFRHITHLHTLKLSGSMVVKMVKALRAVRASVPVSVEELSFDLSRTQQSVRELSRVLSSLASLLRLWNVQCVNLFEHTMEVQSLIVLLCHQGSLTIRLSKEALQQLLVVVYEAQEEEFTQCFLQKVGGDLTPCSLNWKMIQYFLQYHCVTVDFRKSNIKQQNIRELLTVLDRVQLRRLSASFVLSMIREIYETGSAHCVSSLLSSAENFINLNSRDLDSVHWAALCFTLQHCSTVSLSLLWTSIPEGELERIVPLLNHISNLSVDRLLLLRLLHCCSVSEGTAAAVLLSALQHRLDFSCSSTLDLTAHTNTLTLSTEDCRVISTTIQRASTHTQLSLQDCEIEDAGVEQLITIVHKVSLSCSKALLLQFLTLVHVGTESECVRRAVSLSRALGEEVDLSHTPLDLQACRSLALVLEHCEGLSELDLSHCQLTDHCLELLLPHLHKISVLDLNTNHITDHGAGGVHRVVSSNSHIQTVRLFNNGITQKQLFMSDQRFEMW